MFALIAFFIGLFIVFKGSFQLGSRAISQRQARSIGFYLMAPLGILFCASTLMIYNYINFADDGTFTIAPAAFNYVSNTIGILELIAIGVAIALVMYTIYGSAPGSAPASTQQRSKASAAPPQTPASPAAMPNILTVAEAAAYMRITEKEVLGLIDQGKLGAARIGDSYRIARIAIENFMTGN